jgi:hypothetical protein
MGLAGHPDLLPAPAEASVSLPGVLGGDDRLPPDDDYFDPGATEPVGYPGADERGDLPTEAPTSDLLGGHHRPDRPIHLTDNTGWVMWLYIGILALFTLIWAAAFIQGLNP